MPEVEMNETGSNPIDAWNARCPCGSSVRWHGKLTKTTTTAWYVGGTLVVGLDAWPHGGVATKELEIVESK